MIPAVYSVPPWLHDHRFDGRSILPAVESMRLMARALAGSEPALRPNCVREARFLRLIEVGPQEERLDFGLELEQDREELRLVLLRRLALKGMRRTQVCAELRLGRHERDTLPPPPPLAAPERRLTAERLYRELVPFGPAFQSLAGELLFAGAEGEAVVRAPQEAGEKGQGADWLGSPFPLDGAMHLACAHGQQWAAFVPFPLAFRVRRIHEPTRAGRNYRVLVRLCRQEADRLEYDLWLLSETGVCEEVRGLVMGDVSGGRLGPPAWWQLGDGVAGTGLL